MNSATASAPLPGTAGEQEWLTIILRPAGSLDHAAVRRLGTALGHLAAGSDMVIVDLTAAVVHSPRELALALREPARDFERASRCLLVLGASATLTAELDRAAVPVATLAADTLPAPLPAPLAAPLPTQRPARGHSTSARP
jgi:hypothetical protein